MIQGTIRPTAEQLRVIEHVGSAYVAACPGAGKTRVLVERARRLLGARTAGRGLAFLSFTTAAVSELEARLRRAGLLKAPVFPHFIGTFDGFLWQFLIAPFGVPGSTASPRLIPDKEQRLVQPFESARALPLECFDRMTGRAIPAQIRRYNVGGNLSAHETTARKMRARCLERGELDFSDLRDIALSRLHDPNLSPVLATALGARFCELVVDEAQDCNPMDLAIIQWFRATGIPVLVICDPHQSIYGFRGGVSNELVAFGHTFQPTERLPMTGNFRSSLHITRSLGALRGNDPHSPFDEALGCHRNDPTPVHVLAYPGRGVPQSVGAQFRSLTASLGLEPRLCPVVSATRLSSANALGYPAHDGAKHLSYRLALAISTYHCTFDVAGRIKALTDLHAIILNLEGHTADKTYHQYVAESSTSPHSWRPRVIGMMNALRHARFSTVEAWLDCARKMLAPLLPENGQSISQRLRQHPDLKDAFSREAPSGHSARTIHSVKGMEFPAVCVVVSPSKAKQILDYLCDGSPTESSEDARKVYVGASRAQRLLTIAVPRSQSKRLIDRLRATGALVTATSL